MFIIVLEDGRIIGNPKPDYLNRSVFDDYEDAVTFSKTLNSNFTIHELKLVFGVLKPDTPKIDEIAQANLPLFGLLGGMVEYTDSKELSEKPKLSCDIPANNTIPESYAKQLIDFLNPFEKKVC